MSPSFLEFIEHICKRPSMYTSSASVKETHSFIMGFAAGSSAPIHSPLFDAFVCILNSFPSNYAWPHVIEAIATDDQDALRLTEEHIRRYVHLKEQFSDKEIRLFALREAQKNREEEPEPMKEAEMVFRKFDRALLRGNKEDIAPLILAHKDAAILWQGAYPHDVSALLDHLHAGQVLHKTPLSKDGNSFQIIASGWPVSFEMHLIEGDWKINATPVIEMRKASQLLNSSPKH